MYKEIKEKVLSGDVNFISHIFTALPIEVVNKIISEIHPEIIEIISNDSIDMYKTIYYKTFHKRNHLEFAIFFGSIEITRFLFSEYMGISFPEKFIAERPKDVYIVIQLATKNNRNDLIKKLIRFVDLELLQEITHQAIEKKDYNLKSFCMDRLIDETWKLVDHYDDNYDLNRWNSFQKRLKIHNACPKVFKCLNCSFEYCNHTRAHVYKSVCHMCDEFYQPFMSNPINKKHVEKYSRLSKLE